MPQLDKLAYVSEEFWFLFFIICLYISIVSNGLRNVYKILIYRNYIFGLFLKDISTIEESDNKDSKSLNYIESYEKNQIIQKETDKEFDEILRREEYVPDDDTFNQDRDLFVAGINKKMSLSESILEEETLDYEDYVWNEAGNDLWLLQESVEELIRYEDNLIGTGDLIKNIGDVEEISI